MFPENRYRPWPDELYDGPAREDLYDGLLTTFDDSSMRALLGFNDFDSWDNRFYGAFQDKVYGLIDYLQRMGQLHWLVFLVQRKRSGFPVFMELRGRATPPLPPLNAPWPPPPGAGAPTTGPIPLMGAVAPAPPAPPGRSTDPWRTVLLQSGRPFLDRTRLREESQLVGLGNARPILSVGGERDTGKSYSARYLVDVADALDDEHAIVMKEVVLDRLNGVVETGASADIDGLRLARRLATELSDQPLPPYIESSFGSEQDSTWAADTASWIVSRAVEHPRRWLVVDGFENTVLSPSAQALMNSLIAEVGRVGKIRIALLGYTGNLTWCASSVRTVSLDLDDFADPNILKDSVIEFLIEVRRVAALRAGRDYADETLLEDAGRVLRQVNPAAPDLHALEGSLTEIAERVLVGL